LELNASNETLLISFLHPWLRAHRSPAPLPRASVDSIAAPREKAHRARAKEKKTRTTDEMKRKRTEREGGRENERPGEAAPAKRDDTENFGGNWRKRGRERGGKGAGGKCRKVERLATCGAPARNVLSTSRASLARVYTARGGAYARFGGGSAPQRETFTIFAFGIDRFALIYYSRRPSREGGRENTRTRRVATHPSMSLSPPFSSPRAARVEFNSVRYVPMTRSRPIRQRASPGAARRGAEKFRASRFKLRRRYSETR